MIQDCGIEDEIPLTNVTSKTLEKVIEYCKHVKSNPAPEISKPLKSANLSEIIDDKFYIDYI